jgi:hypothetical protein
VTVLLLSLKLTLAPSLVGAATHAARRLGHRAGGLVGGLPVVAAPIVLIYALEHGTAFAAQAAAATVLGVVSLVAFCAAYAAAASRSGRAGRAGVPLALMAGWAAFGASTWFFADRRLGVWTGALLALAAVLLAGRSLAGRAPERREAARGRDLLIWRLLVTGAMVLALTTASGPLSPWLSGLLAPFPIITAVLAGFTHAQAGGGASIALLAGLVPGLVSFALFFVVAAVALPGVGIAAGFGLATGAALLSHAVIAVALRFPRV